MPASLSEIVNVVISRQSQQISRKSFSIPLIAAFHAHWTDFVRTYSASTMLKTMVTEGFSTSEPAYLMASAVLSQSPHPKTIKIGRLTGTWTQEVTLIPTAANTTVYTGRVNEQPWTFTSDGSATLAEVCTGIAAAITALSGVTATGASGTTVVITADAAATPFTVIKAGVGTGVYSFSDTTAAGTIAAEVAELRAADVDWYAFDIDRSSEAAIEAVAAWAETDVALFLPTSSDSLILDPASTTDVAYDLHASGYDRTSLWYHEDPTSHLGLAVGAAVLPYFPGSAQWATKNPKGVTVSTLSTNSITSLDAKKANYLITLAGLRVTYTGVVASGEWVDIIQGVDWLYARLQEDVFAWLAGAPKRPYTDQSVTSCMGVVNGVLQEGVKQNILRADPAPFVEGPKVADIDEADRAARVLPDITFSAQLAGAILYVDPLQGAVSV